jgi:hypothetical protein
MPKHKNNDFLIQIHYNCAMASIDTTDVNVE